MIGQKFGRLTVIGEAPRGKRREARVECICSCGNPDPVIVNRTDLKRGRVRSCGCLAVEIGRAKAKRRRGSAEHHRELKADGVPGNALAFASVPWR